MRIKIIARCQIAGSKTREPGWRLTEYEADTDKKVCRFLGAVTSGMYPNKANYAYTAEVIDRYVQAGYIYVQGRPRYESVMAGVNI